MPRDRRGREEMRTRTRIFDGMRHVSWAMGLIWLFRREMNTFNGTMRCPKSFDRLTRASLNVISRYSSASPLYQGIARTQDGQNSRCAATVGELCQHAAAIRYSACCCKHGAAICTLNTVCKVMLYLRSRGGGWQNLTADCEDITVQNGHLKQTS